MGPSQILQHLVPGDPVRHEASAELLKLLNQQVARRLYDRHSLRPASYVIPEGERDEIVARVLTKIIAKSPLPVAGKLDEQATTYLNTMLLRCWLTELRQRQRLELPGDDKIDGKREMSPDETPAPDMATLAARARELLDRLFAALLRRRQRRYYEGLTRAWRQICELVFDDARFPDVLARDEGLAPDAPLPDVKRVKDRVFKAHERLREGLLATADDLRPEDGITEEEGRQARAAVRLLYRCQRDDAPGVQIAEAENDS
jgi:DNA-directed RNA polymerase specialized sigma24 family protein